MAETTKQAPPKIKCLCRVAKIDQGWQSGFWRRTARLDVIPAEGSPFAMTGLVLPAETLAGVNEGELLSVEIRPLTDAEKAAVPGVPPGPPNPPRPPGPPPVA